MEESKIYYIKYYRIMNDADWDDQLDAADSTIYKTAYHELSDANPAALHLANNLRMDYAEENGLDMNLDTDIESERRDDGRLEVFVSDNSEGTVFDVMVGSMNLK